MARKVLNRKELREANDAAEADEAKAPKKEKAAKKPTAKEPCQNRQGSPPQGVLGCPEPIAEARRPIRI